MEPARLLATLLCGIIASAAAAAELTLDRDGHWLVVRGAHLPAGELRINYLEAYCRAGSSDADWVAHTRIPHASELVARGADGRSLELRDVLADGVVVDHRITAGDDAVAFRLSARNPGTAPSTVHWAQPCIRLGAFAGSVADHTVGDPLDYLPRCFVFLDGALARMPTPQWTTTARYTPGQVWCPAGVPRADVNPRPLNPRVTSNGLIGCFSGDGTLIAATAWEPYQELFQGVARCLHADPRIGGLAPGETRTARGMLYLVPADVPALLGRYQRDFPEHVAAP